MLKYLAPALCLLALPAFAQGTSIKRMDDKGNLKPFLSKYQGKRLNSPNDLVFAKDGALWFTDPSFGLPGGWPMPIRSTPCAMSRVFQ